jgi:RNA polymerase sigma-70 factor (ECF subfamily)
MANKIDIAHFETVFSEYHTKVFRTAMGFVHSKEDAEDLTQEVFIRAYRSRNSFRGDAGISTWLYRITVNLALNHIGREKRRTVFRPASDSLDDYANRDGGEKTPHKLLESSELRENIRRAIDSLPDKQRTAFVLSKYEELPGREIAEVMKTSEGAVEQLLQRAKGNLQKKLNKNVGK